MSTRAALAELEALIGSGHGLVYLHTAEEDRWERALRRLAEGLGIRLSAWTATQGLEGAVPALDLASPRALLEHLAALVDHLATRTERAWYLLKDLHPHLQDPWVVRKLRELERSLSAQGSALLLIAPLRIVPLDLERDVAVLELPLPDVEDLRPLVQSALKRARAALPLAERPHVDLAERIERSILGLTERDATRVLARAVASHDPATPAFLRAILSQKRRVLAQSELLEFLEPGASLADLGGLEMLKAWIERRGGAFGEAARSKGLKPPGGLLILGVQGCGKSLASRVVADAWGFPLVRLDLSAVIRAERQGRDEGLKRALRVAERLAPAVLWVDELEKGFADSGAEAEGSVARALATFLTWIQEKDAPVFVVATANRVDRLPAELIRKGRFDEMFFVDLPTLGERRQIAAIHLAKRGLEPARFDLTAIARGSAGLSGSEIEQAVLSASYEAFAEARDVSSTDVLAALKSSVPLSITMAEQIDALREWAEKRARPACLDNRLTDMIAETMIDGDEDVQKVRR